MSKALSTNTNTPAHQPQRDRRRKFTPRQARQIAERSGGRCWQCRLPLALGYHVHHLMPWASGGLTEVDNGIALCKSCHATWHAPKEG